MRRRATWLLLLLAGPLADMVSAGSGTAAAHAQAAEPTAPVLLASPGEQEQQLRAALRLSPRDAALHARLGEVLLEQGRPEEALASYQEAVRLAPASPELRHQLAEAALALGQWAQAEAEFRAAIERDPSRAALYAGLGEALRMQDRSAEAGAAYRRALTLQPENPRYRQALAELDEITRMEKDRRAASLLQRALTLLAALPLSIAGLALILPCAAALALLLRSGAELALRRVRPRPR